MKKELPVVEENSGVIEPVEELKAANSAAAK